MSDVNQEAKDSSVPDLLPCPFCGGKAGYAPPFKVGTPSSGGKQLIEPARVFCLNDKCVRICNMPPEQWNARILSHRKQGPAVDNEDKILATESTEMPPRNAAASPELNQWQPIETAPKDDTAVLILFADGAIIKAQWQDVDWNEWSQTTSYGWVGVGRSFSEHDEQPMHWMPSPGSLPPESKSSVVAASTSLRKHSALVMGTRELPMPEGEDNTAYNPVPVAALWKEVIGPVERERLEKHPWMRTLANDLVRRIANLRGLLIARTVPSGQREVWDTATGIVDTTFAVDGGLDDQRSYVAGYRDAKRKIRMRLQDARDAVPASIGYDQRTIEAAAKRAFDAVMITGAASSVHHTDLQRAAIVAANVRALATTPTQPADESHDIFKNLPAPPYSIRRAVGAANANNPSAVDSIVSSHGETFAWVIRRYLREDAEGEWNYVKSNRN